MSLFIATGSNLGDRKQQLDRAKLELSRIFEFIAESRIYESPAVDYLNQPDFYNQVLEFQLPKFSPSEVMSMLLKLEQNLGRNREVPKGPRIIDLDILFWGFDTVNLPHLTIPHPSLFERSFVVLPLSELPGFKDLNSRFSFNFSFNNTASPISSLT
ncbi:MAG: 2-amino-4-hydroxy-6-hydroxymethyldihydropteridine diphosphokinase [Bacteriovoracaceae bacterium]|nr:2-amino-4-hydroxy-6-hydroxymethyldihydropteridine diphosphokinase [Bacteriovoracaceae bacterium]